MKLQIINLSLCLFYKFIYTIYFNKCEIMVGSSWVGLERRNNFIICEEDFFYALVLGNTVSFLNNCAIFRFGLVVPLTNVEWI